VVGTVLRFADHLTGVCQALPEHVFPGSARVRTSYHLHPAQPILARATVVHPAIAGQSKVPPPSRCGASPAVRERAGKGNSRPEQVHGGTMPEVKATGGARTGASLHDDAGVDGKPVDDAQDLSGSHVGGDSRGCAGEGDRSGRKWWVSDYTYGHTRWIGLGLADVVTGGGVGSDGHGWLRLVM